MRKKYFVGPGSKFGRWTVIDRDKTRTDKVFWLVFCECGKTKSVVGVNLNNGTSTSCGCLRKEMVSKRRTKHGLSGSPEHRAWKFMKVRCYNPNSTNYKRWGGRGIKVCDAWNVSFNSFLRDMGTKPSPKHSLDRINNDGNYEPGNCRWATLAEQANNRKKRLITKTKQSNNKIKMKGEQNGS